MCVDGKAVLPATHGHNVVNVSCVGRKLPLSAMDDCRVMIGRLAPLFITLVLFLTFFHVFLYVFIFSLQIMASSAANLTRV